MDIHQQLQENSLSSIKLPRDISNTDIPSGASSPRMPRRKPAGQESDAGNQDSKEHGQGDGVKEGRHKTLPQTSKTAMMKTWLSSMPAKLNKNSSIDLQVPKLNIKPMNLVSKIKSGGMGAGQLLSKVAGTSIFYKNSPDTEEVDVFVSGLPDEVSMKPRLDRKRTISKDDSSIDEMAELKDEDLEKEEVVLDSCGILATNAKQIIRTPNCSFDEEIIEGVDEVDLGDDIRNVEEETEGVGNVSDGKRCITPNKRMDMTYTGVAETSEANVKDELKVTSRGRSSSFQTGIDVHKTSDEEDVWVKQSDAESGQKEVVTKPQDLQLQQGSGYITSEAERILAKYSNKKAALTHPNMRTSMSDSALSSQVKVNLEQCATDDSPKSVLDLNLEINEDLQKTLPNLLQSAKMPRKTLRIYENLKQHIEKRLGDKVCHSTIIFV